MTTTIDLPDDLLEDIRLRAALEGRGLDETVAQLLRAGLAASSSRPVTTIPADASMLEERRRIAEKFRTGEWGVDLPGFEEGRVADRDVAEMRERGEVERTSRRSGRATARRRRS
jgi:plasmid stability protein